MKLLQVLWFSVAFLACTWAIPVALLYDHNVPEARRLPTEDDASSPQVRLRVPVVFFGTKFDSLFVNTNGLISFQTEIPNFFNVQFPLDYPLIAPFYTNVDIRGAGTISYYETNNPNLLQRASDNVRDSFSNEGSFQATSLFVVTWFGVGYYNRGTDKINTYQVAIASDGSKTFVEFLYPKDGLQWIQGTGDQSGLPDARAQTGFISADGKIFTLPGSGTEQVRNLEVWSNINLSGQFVYRVDQANIIQPDLHNELTNQENAQSCADAPTSCHDHARCVDYEEGFCCECKKDYYGNGKFCVKKEVPLRVNGKVNGKINGERLENLDLQSYIVMADGRAYTAISRIPESIGSDFQSLQILGGVIGYVFAKPIKQAPNGYELTGGVFNHTATLRFHNTSQSITIKQKYIGLDVFDQLRLETEIDGEIPNLPLDAVVNIDEYQEQYTLTSPGVIQMSSTRILSYNTSLSSNEDVILFYDLEQVFLFDYCKFENITVGETWKLKVGKNFVQYDSKQQIIRFGLSNKVTPFGDQDPCEEGRSQCGQNSVCVVDNDSYRCVCNPGFQQTYQGNGTYCSDIDECQTRLHDCDFNARCINVIGSYTCQCNPGFEGNGQICTNALSCSNVRCAENSECIDINNVAICKCLPGFSGDGQTCTPIIDHSCHTANNCAQFGICTIDRETNRYYCACLPGYEGDGYTCARIPPPPPVENSTEPAPRREIQRCLLTVCWCPEGYKIEQGTIYCIPENEPTESPTSPIPDSNDTPEVQCYNSSLCFCPKGYSLVSNSCVPVGTKETKGHSGFNLTCNVFNNCHRDAQCILTDSNYYACVCNEGFEGDGYQCEVPETSCAELDNCHPDATCTYDEMFGKSRCICNPGYDGNGFNCKITAICNSHDDCTDTEDCLLTSQQRYECVCKEGHARDSQNQCVSLNTTCGGGICVKDAECLYDDEQQVQYCECREGFMGDGISECRPRPIGCNIRNNCGLHANCHFDPSTNGYECRCDPDFYGDGFVCYKEITCQNDPSICDPQASCITDAFRKYICQCNNGFMGNGTYCQPNPTHEGNFLLLNQGMATLRIPFEQTKNNLGKPIQIKYFQTAVGLDIDCVEGRVYWGDISGRAIRSSTYNGSSKSDFITKNVGSPEGVAVDWVSRNIYWTDSTSDTIEVASIDTKRRRVLFNTSLVNPRGIAVHPQRGKIFWTDWDRRNPRIEWANADGTGRQVFLHCENASLPNSLAIDFETEQLCYADAGTKRIECVAIDGRIRRTVATNCTYPFGITVTDRHVYWSDWISNKIEKVDKYSFAKLPPLQVPLGGSGNKRYGLVAVPQRCPDLTNVCQYYKNQCPAEHICLPNGGGSRRCVCTFNADDPDEVTSCTL